MSPGLRTSKHRTDLHEGGHQQLPGAKIHARVDNLLGLDLVRDLGGGAGSESAREREWG